MLLELERTVLAKPLLGIVEEALVGEISRLLAPVRRNLLLRDLDLLGLDLESDVLPALAVIRPVAQHALVRDDSESEEIHHKAVILLEHDLRRHVARRAAHLFCQARGVISLHAGDAKVGDVQVAAAVEQQVLWFDIAVDDLSGVHEL